MGWDGFYKGELAKKRGLAVCRFKRGLVKEEGVYIFEGAWYSNAHYVEMIWGYQLKIIASESTWKIWS